MLKREMSPVHPGVILKDLFMDPLGLGVQDLADNLGVARKTISSLVNGHQGISVEMALRLAKAFNTSTDVWINMQKDLDILEAVKKIDLGQVRILTHIKKTDATHYTAKRA